MKEQTNKKRNKPWYFLPLCNQMENIFTPKSRMTLRIKNGLVK